MSDATEYQSAETSWRFHSRRSQLRDKIAHVEKALAELQMELVELESKPPLYNLFNWSA